MARSILKDNQKGYGRMSSAFTRLLDQTVNVDPSEMLLEAIGCPISLESIRRSSRIRRRDRREKTAVTGQQRRVTYWISTVLTARS